MSLREISPNCSPFFLVFALNHFISRGRGEDIKSETIDPVKSVPSFRQNSVDDIEFPTEDNFDNFPIDETTGSNPASQSSHSFELGSFDLSDGFFETDALTHFIPRLSVNGKSATNERSRLKEIVEFEGDVLMEHGEEGATENNCEDHPESDPFEPFRPNHRISQRENSQIRNSCMNSSAVLKQIEPQTKVPAVVPTSTLSLQAPPFPNCNRINKTETISGNSYLMKDLQAEKTRISIEICDLMEQLDTAYDEMSSSHITMKLSELRSKRCKICIVFIY